MRTFLTADWRYLLMLNYAVEPDLLRPRVPAGVELEHWNGKTFVSMVGFLFQRTTVLGFRAPFHTDFEEVNLRFYVRRRGPEGWRRGVVFIKEIVPRIVIATVARVCYNEPTRRCQCATGSTWKTASCETAALSNIRGVTKVIGTRFAPPRSVLRIPRAKIQKRNSSQSITGVTPRKRMADAWNIASSIRVGTYGRSAMRILKCDVASLYGTKFVDPLGASPESAFIADGSAVTVSTGAVLPAPAPVVVTAN